MKMNWWKLENWTAKIKTNLEAMNSPLNDTEEWISDPEDRIMEINQSKYQTGRQMKQGKESNVRDSWVIIKLANLSKIWASGEEKEKRIENVFEEIMAENFPT